jgi:hypothetical protein
MSQWSQTTERYRGQGDAVLRCAMSGYALAIAIAELRCQNLGSNLRCFNSGMSHRGIGGGCSLQDI